MPRSRSFALVVVLLLAGCGGGGGDDPRPSTDTPEVELSGAAGRAPAPATAGTLSKVAIAPESARRIAFVNLDRLTAVRLPVPRTRLLEQVLGRGAGPARGERGTAVQVADATVLHGAAAPTVIGGSPRLAELLKETAPRTSAITPIAQSAAQSCLGDTLAQTIVGPGTLGDDNALGVGLAESGDAPAGIQLRICGAPRLIRDLHAMERRLDDRFGHLGERANIEEREIGEREIVTGTIAADALRRRDVLQLLSGGHALRELAWR